MSDFERYGDYNEIDESPNKSIVGIIFKAIIFIITATVIGVIAFRLIVFNNYPKESTNIYFTDELFEYYESVGGNIEAYTQEMLDSRNFGYDDSRDGNFFAKNMIYVPATEQLQVTIRYNTSLMDSIEKKYGVRLDENSDELFEYRLVGMRNSDAPGDGEDPGKALECELEATIFTSSFMYRYVKLSFDGVDLATDTPDAFDWIRLEIFIKGVDEAEPYKILIYYDSENFPLIPYKLSSKEKPQ